MRNYYSKLLFMGFCSLLSVQSIAAPDPTTCLGSIANESNKTWIISFSDPKAVSFKDSNYCSNGGCILPAGKSVNFQYMLPVPPIDYDTPTNNTITFNTSSGKPSVVSYRFRWNFNGFDTKSCPAVLEGSIPGILFNSPDEGSFVINKDT